MKQLANELRQFVKGAPAPKQEVELSTDDIRLFRSLKTAGERATKGRLISSCVFEAKLKRGGISLMMLMEGRHAMSVGKQVARGFEKKDEIELVDVVRTKQGACVILRPMIKEEEETKQ